MLYADLRYWQLRQHFFLPEEAASWHHQMCRQLNIRDRKPINVTSHLTILNFDLISGDTDRVTNNKIPF